MAISLDFWRSVQRLRIDAERRERALERAAREAAARRRPKATPRRRAWELPALYLVAIAAPVVVALGVSPQALRSNAQFLLGVAMGETPRAEQLPPACPGGRAAEATALVTKGGCERGPAGR